MKNKYLTAVFSALVGTSLLLSFPTENVQAKGIKTEQIPTSVVDTRKLPEKEFAPKLISNDTNISTLAASAPYWTAKSTFGGSAGTTTSDSYGSPDKSTRYNIDHIYAKARVYVNQVFKAENSDDQYNTSKAGITVYAQTSFWDDGETFGLHKFEHSGYQSWYPDSYGT